MKGLLLKDWYMVWKYCKYYFLLGIVFFAFSIVEDNMFFVFYPCLLCGIIPANLLVTTNGAAGCSIVELCRIPEHRSSPPST